MDKQSNSTIVPLLSIPVIGTTETGHRVTIEELKALSFDDLQHLIDFFRNLDEIVAAFLCQPKFFRADMGLTAAGLIADELGSHLSWCSQLVAQAAQDIAPKTADDERKRAWLLIGAAAYYQGGLTNFLRDVNALVPSNGEAA